MNPKTWFLLIVALVGGVGAALCVKSIFFAEPTEQVVDENAGIGTKERTLVANFDLPSGTELTAQNVRFDLLPESQIPRDAIFSFEGFSGRKTLNDLKAGTPITLYDLVLDEETETSETSFVPPGYSIVPIEIQTAVNAKGGRNFLKTTPLDRMIKAGDVVDLAVVKEDSGSVAAGDSSLAAAPVRRPRLTTTRIVENVDVFAVSDEKTFAADDGAQKRVSIVSVLLSAEQREIVRKASEEGKIKVLSNGDDSESFDEASALDLTSIWANPTSDSNANVVADGASQNETEATEDATALEIPMNDDVVFPALDAAVAESREESAAAPQEESVQDVAPLDLISEAETDAPTDGELDAGAEDDAASFVEIPTSDDAEANAGLDTNFSTNAVLNLPEDLILPENLVAGDELASPVPLRERVPNVGVSEFVELPAADEETEIAEEENDAFLELFETSDDDASSKSFDGVRFERPNVDNFDKKTPVSSASEKKFHYYSPFVTKKR